MTIIYLKSHYNWWHIETSEGIIMCNRHYFTSRDSAIEWARSFASSWYYVRVEVMNEH